MWCCAVITDAVSIPHTHDSMSCEHVIGIAKANWRRPSRSAPLDLRGLEIADHRFAYVSVRNNPTGAGREGGRDVGEGGRE